MKQQFLTDIAGTIRLNIYADNVAVVPTSATITLYKNSGAELQAETAATVNPITGEITYNLTTAHTADTGLNFKAKWSYVVSGVTYYENQLFDIVKSVLSIPITDDDLYDELDSLRESAKQVNGTIASATSSTFTDTKRKEPDSYWKGGTVSIVSGAGSGQKTNITASVQSTGVFSVSPSFSTTPDSTSNYKLVRSFANKIRQTFEKLEEMLYNMGKRQDLILESSQLKYPAIYLAIHFIGLDLSDQEGDKWDRLAKSYWEKFNESFNGLRLEYDDNETGNIEGGEEEAQQGEVRLFRG